MNSEKLKEWLNKIPFTLIAMGYLGYLGYQYYDFMNDTRSPLAHKRQEIEAVKTQNVQLQAKVRQAMDFYKSLETKKSGIRGLAGQLDEMKVTLSEDLDIAGFIKMVITEAKRSGLNVLALKPTSLNKKEYYSEQAFELTFKGIFSQVLVFLDRISNVQRIVRIDNYEIRPIGSNTARYVELEGRLQIKTYRYLGSSADQIGHADAGGSATPKQPAPAGGASGDDAAKAGAARSGT